MKTRRQFLQLSGMGLLASAVPDIWKTPFASKRPGISVQLYTIREAIKLDIRASLQKLAALGFKNVETAFWPDGISLAQASAYLREFGLGVSSCHIEIPEGDKKQAMLDTAKAYGCTKMIWHGWPEDKRYSSLEGTRELIKIYNNASRFAKDNGLQFGLHNHWWEYRNKPGGTFVYEILNQELDKDIFFEVDTYWVKVAGHQPAKIMEQLGERIKYLHIKDGPAVYKDNLAADNPDPMTAVGKGTQDFPAILKAAGNHPDWLVIEMDKTATDVFEALAESLKYLKGIMK
jgi:sugar phosphate isomerase/epimerase